MRLYGRFHLGRHFCNKYQSFCKMPEENLKRKKCSLNHFSKKLYLLEKLLLEAESPIKHNVIDHFYIMRVCIVITLVLVCNQLMI